MIQWGLGLVGILLLIFSGLVYKKNGAIRAINTENEKLINNLKDEIHQRKQVEKELAESDSLRELLLDIITHDLKNPASTIFSMSDLALNEFPGNEYLDLIHLSSTNLLEVLKNTTLLSQATFGEQIPIEDLNLEKLMTKLSGEFKSSLKEVDMTLSIDIPHDLMIHANPLIAEVFKNYISNACKYASAGKEIIIDATQEAEWLVVSVRDFADTIPEADREAIFDRQMQLGNGEKKGRGLGLAIVKRIARAHAAEVWVEPNHPTGNRFCIRFLT